MIRLFAARVTMAMLVACATSCGQSAPRAYGEALFVVDSDLPASIGFDQLRIDLYAQDGTWFGTRDVIDFGERRPVSFSVYSDDDAHEKFVWVRLRSFPAGRLRDTPTSGVPRLVLDGVDVTPAVEPAPHVAIDRLLVVRLRPGVKKQLPVTLHGACSGTEAILRKSDASRGPVGHQAATCIDQGGERVLVEEDIETSSGAPRADPHTWAVLPCEAATETGGEERICVPGGPFLLGAWNPSYVFGVDRTPERVVIVSRFAIDRDEVTVRRYREAMATGMPPPAARPQANPGRLGADPLAPIAPCTWSETPLQREDYPLNCITRESARAFCKFSGGELPTEAQWEYAAAMAGRERKAEYVWGSDDPSCERAVYAREPGPRTGPDSACNNLGLGVRPVGEYADVTPLGIRGFAGGLSEWTSDAAVPFDAACWQQLGPRRDPSCTEGADEHGVVRGGAWGGAAGFLRATLRWQSGPGHRSAIVGFRCVYNSSKSP